MTGSYEFSFVPRDTSPDVSVALNEMSRLFGIPERWTRNDWHVVDVATAKIREQVDADLSEGISLSTEAEFEAMLGKLCQRMKHQRGLQHYFVPATSWLLWASDNLVPQLWERFKPQTQAAIN